MKPDVSIVSCADYSESAVSAALEAALAPFGGLDWVTPGMRVAVKVNLLGAHKPERAATTHPALVAGLCKMLAARGADVVVGDSPGGFFTRSYLAPVYRATGMYDAVAAGARLNDDFSEADAPIENGVRLSEVRCTKYLLDADAVIDFCKLKSHGLMAYTGACKNFFGIVPGMKKSELHYRFSDADAFAEMLVDLCEFVKPRICLADAVMAMEGNGPTSGTPRFVGALLAAENAHALDLVGAHLMGLSASDVPTLAAALRRGLIPERWDALTVEGDVPAFVVPGFAAAPIRNIRSWGGGNPTVTKVLTALLADRPAVQKDICIGCGICARHCPMHAIEMRDHLPVVNREACIGCFCCQEFCERAAMRVYRPPLARLLYR